MAQIIDTLIEKPISSVPPIEDSTLKVPPPVSKSAIDRKAEEIKKLRELPTKPGNSVTFSELCKWLKLLDTEEKRKRISLYVYRHYPVIIRQQADPNYDNNIDVIVDGFGRLSESYFIERHGGGTYGITVADCEGYRDKKTTNGFFSAKLEIPISEHDPKLNLIEVDWENIKNKGFQAWAKAKGLIDSRNMPITPGLQQTNTNTSNSTSTDNNTVQVMKVMMDFFSKMNDSEKTAVRKSLESGDPMSKAIGELMVEKLKQDDPNKTANMFSTMLTAMTTAMNSSRGKDDGGGGLASIMPMFQMMMESQNRTTTLIVELMKAQNESKSSESGKGEGASSLTQLRELIEVAKELKGDSHKQSTTELLIDKGLDILGPVLNVVGNIVALKMAQGGVPQVAPVTTVPGSQQQPQSTPGLPTPAPQSPVQPSPQSSPAGPQSNQSQPSQSSAEFDLQNAINQFAPLIVSNFNKDGYLLPDMVVSFFPQGDMIVASIVRHGTDEIISKMKSSPLMNWPQIQGTYGEEFVRQWVDDFVHYKEILAEIESGENGDDVENDNDDRSESEDHSKLAEVTKIKEKK